MIYGYLLASPQMPLFFLKFWIMKKSTNSVRAISFGEILTSRGLYVVLIVFAAAALGKFLFTGQSVNSTASLNSTLSQVEATKIKLA